MSQLKRADFCGSDRSIERRLYYIDGDDSEGSYLVIEAARGTGAVQYRYRKQLTHSRLSSDKNLCLWTDKRQLLHRPRVV